MRTPRFIYGTAWKEDATCDLVKRALAAGFRAFDTANQRKHYFEAAVGEAIAGHREEIFLQTKFTHRDGQDDRLPYEPSASITKQVEQSFESSLEHLRTSRIDAYVLHGPSARHGLAPEDLEAWRAMETLPVGALGVSNVTAKQLALLVEHASVRPSFVQNRCYASRRWDREVRALCTQHGIVYQAFSLLTANRREMAHPTVLSIAKRRSLTPAQVVFRFAIDVGMLPLTGTSSDAHMKEDLRVLDDPPLAEADVRAIENL